MSDSHPRGRRRHFIVFGLLCAILGGFAAWLVVASIDEVRLNRAIIVDYDTARHEIKTIAESLAHHASREGDFPRSFAEWERTEPNLKLILTTQSAATEATYAIDFDALGDPERIVTMTPDRDLQRFVPRGLIDWRGAYRWATGPGQRMVVMGDATIEHGMYVPYEQRRAFAAWAGWSFDERIRADRVDRREPPRKE